jgi:hypothetical protein
MEVAESNFCTDFSINSNDFLVNNTDFFMNNIDFSKIRPDRPMPRQFLEKQVAFLNPDVNRYFYIYFSTDVVLSSLLDAPRRHKLPPAAARTRNIQRRRRSTRRRATVPYLLGSPPYRGSPRSRTRFAIQRFIVFSPTPAGAARRARGRHGGAGGLARCALFRGAGPVQLLLPEAS